MRGDSRPMQAPCSVNQSDDRPSRASAGAMTGPRRKGRMLAREQTTMKRFTASIAARFAMSIHPNRRAVTAESDSLATPGGVVQDVSVLLQGQIQRLDTEVRHYTRSNVVTLDRMSNSISVTSTR
jgi:hypothetical protein